MHAFSVSYLESNKSWIFYIFFQITILSYWAMTVTDCIFHSYFNTRGIFIKKNGLKDTFYTKIAQS